MEVFDLGRAYSDAARIKALEAETEDRRRRTDLYERSLTQTKEPTFEDAVNNYALVRAGAAVVMRDPAQAPAVIADLKRRGVLSADVNIPQGAQPEQIAQLAKEWYDQTSAALAAIDPSKYGEQATGPKIGQYNPGDYTPETWAEFLQSKDPRGLKRQYAPPAPPNMSVIQLPEGQAAFNPRTAAVTPLSSREEQRAANVADEAAKSQATASATAGVEQNVKAAERQAAWRLYESAMAGLKSGLAGTSTGPVSGRVPPVTAAQQTAEGGVAAMAPVMKQLFRVAGEGVFTDRDQELLLEMIPKRTDHPEARAAKIANIDAIVRAKLGISAAAQDNDPLGIRK